MESLFACGVCVCVCLTGKMCNKGGRNVFIQVPKKVTEGAEKQRASDAFEWVNKERTDK